MQNNGIETGWRSLKDKPTCAENQCVRRESWKHMLQLESMAYTSSFNFLPPWIQRVAPLMA